MNIKETKDGTLIDVYVKPKSSKFFIKLENNKLIIYCTEPPIKGKANREIEKNLSKFFKAKAIIVSGHTSQHKRILIHGLNSEKVRHVLSKLETKENNTISNDHLRFKATIVHLILNNKTEEAIRLLSEYYRVSIPKVRIGMPKGHVKSAACYVERTRTIHFSKREVLANPLIVLHEFYHHLRSMTDWHGGIEKNADKFAESFLTAYKKFMIYSST